MRFDAGGPVFGEHVDRGGLHPLAHAGAVDVGLRGVAHGRKVHQGDFKAGIGLRDLDPVDARSAADIHQDSDLPEHALHGRALGRGDGMRMHECGNAHGRLGAHLTLFPFGSAGLRGRGPLARLQRFQELAMIRRNALAKAGEEPAPIAFALGMQPCAGDGGGAPFALALLHQAERAQSRKMDRQRPRIDADLRRQRIRGQRRVGEGAERPHLVGHRGDGHHELRFPQIPYRPVVRGGRQCAAHRFPLPVMAVRRVLAVISRSCRSLPSGHPG